ncbi:MAG: response regulator, partial [Thermodesulfobacteriota bacterium]
RPRRLLVVDDEPIVGKRLQQAFGKQGLEVAVFGNAAAALAELAVRPADVVVTDLKMDGLDGLELLRRIRALYPAIRVIIITGYASPETAEAAFREGVFEFLAKPFRLDELKQAVARALAELDR